MKRPPRCPKNDDLVEKFERRDEIRDSSKLVRNMQGQYMEAENRLKIQQGLVRS
jgi:hypothetical protein